MKKALFVFTLIAALVIGGFTPASAKAKKNKNIPDGALSYNGHYYYYFEGSLTWEEAEAECEKLGGYLVVFANENEEKAVWDYIKDKGTPAWIGVYNAGSIDRVFNTVDDDWKTVTGAKLKYTNWVNDQPDHQNHFVQNTYDMWAAIGKPEEVGFQILDDEKSLPCLWGDFDDNYFVNNGTIKGYICEWPVYEIKVETKEITVKKGKKTTISYTIIDKAGNTKVKDAKASLKSSNKKIAKALKSGNIKGVAEGNCTITLKYKGATAKVKVTVTPKKKK